PEDPKGLVEQVALVIAVHEHCVQCPVEVYSVRQPHGLDGANGLEHAPRAYRQAGGSQESPEMHDVCKQGALLDEGRGSRHGTAAVASSASTWLSSRAASPPRTRPISSWYLSRAPKVSLIVAGSRTIRSSATRARVQSIVSATP